MRADLEDQLGSVSKRNGNPLVKLLPVVAILAGLLLFWYRGDQPPQETNAPAPPVVAPVPPAVVPVAPDIPQRVEPVVADDEATVVPAGDAGPTLPTPQESDALLLEQLAVTGANTLLADLASKEHPLDVSAALIDGMGRGILLRKILPASPPTEAFTVEQAGENTYMNRASYDRYDSYAAAIATLDPDTLVTSFHTLRPLFERAYEGLGLDSGDFDNAVIRTLDAILATPEIEDPITLRQKSVMYLYADPELEKLPPIQKQLMRMGPDNIRLIKQQAQALRDGLLAQ